MTGSGSSSGDGTGLSAAAPLGCARARPLASAPGLSTRSRSRRPPGFSRREGVALVPEKHRPGLAGRNVVAHAASSTRELTAYTRTEWSPPARAFLEALRAQRWSRKPRNAEVIS